MMNRTELVIAKAFWQLLEEKPYSKITVKNIVERCEINRNTFYYHFHDIPDLLDRILKKMLMILLINPIILIILLIALLLL